MHNHLPRITIKYCTQCKWLLRAAYFAQELLSTFSTQLGEVALVPATGGVFTVTMYHSSSTTSTSGSSAGTAQGEEVPVPVVVAGTGNGNEEEDDDVTEIILWDRKTNGGFPEVKVLKSLVRNVVDPSRDLGHTDRALRAANVPVQSQEGGEMKVVGKSEEQGSTTATTTKEGDKCEECQ
ncbi:hypothetical protein AtubIFM56815_003376 [Aspergillus tubingensis]|uniref:Uncharacterized protein n=1 Tax=Aspergillus tubingensis TaxID=5068 RepID=A0A8H3XY61_ASPTU|nr:selenoprotein domain protein [Aspergillus tubingensis]GFN15544.1 selenoprotein domain protein [Aspergillus tubingensis]GLA88909.1 hypothetical protein AtubIFM56815_003376 [Aspergillus tubingensis]GLA93069.1 hypothetical protein AtubIFM57143_010049 [Aspergillus tubingensis]GLB15106.1 hypothetical protein AtubIFM61612_004916 [Aspergillus tubingensis]